MENFLVVVSAGLADCDVSPFPIVRCVLSLITGFLTLHSVGAHYSYAHVPLGGWLKEAFHQSRNHYDRLVHFSFGLMLAYPAREVLVREAEERGLGRIICLWMLFWRGARCTRSWNPGSPRSSSPGLGDAWLGTQGDIWDSQNDMTCALAGAILCMLITAIVKRYFRRAGI